MDKCSKCKDKHIQQGKEKREANRGTEKQEDIPRVFEMEMSGMAFQHWKTQTDGFDRASGVGSDAVHTWCQRVKSLWCTVVSQLQLQSQLAKFTLKREALFSSYISHVDWLYPRLMSSYTWLSLVYCHYRHVVVVSAAWPHSATRHFAVPSLASIHFVAVAA